MINKESKIRILKVIEELGKLSKEEKQYFNKVLKVGEQRGGKAAAMLLRYDED